MRRVRAEAERRDLRVNADDLGRMRGALHVVPLLGLCKIYRYALTFIAPNKYTMHL